MGRKRKAWLLLLLLPGLLLVYWWNTRVIGSVAGPEQDSIVIDGLCYVEDRSDLYQSYSAADRGRYLGRVTDGGQVRLRVYSVKGDAERAFLYALFGYEGCFYVREDLVKESSGL
ncbi:MAG: hypothetical protein IJP07_01240 [Firmicutes bacterium]|nr:hypothetical protein [Bacillota bacterium]